MMEEETKLFLKKIMQTVFIGLFWMFANVIFGIFLEAGYILNKITFINILYYTIAFISLLFLIRFYLKLWNQ